MSSCFGRKGVKVLQTFFFFAGKVFHFFNLFSCLILHLFQRSNLVFEMGDQNCSQYSKQGCTINFYRGIMIADYLFSAANDNLSGEMGIVFVKKWSCSLFPSNPCQLSCAFGGLFQIAFPLNSSKASPPDPWRTVLSAAVAVRRKPSEDFFLLLSEAIQSWGGCQGICVPLGI